jgi:hypothetical protein
MCEKIFSHANRTLLNQEGRFLELNHQREFLPSACFQAEPDPVFDVVLRAPVLTWLAGALLAASPLLATPPAAEPQPLGVPSNRERKKLLNGFA